MIKTESLTIDDRDFICTYSDSGKYVVRDGISYEEAVDPAELGRVYTEGDAIPMEDPTDEDFAQMGKIMMGVMP